MTAPGLGRLHVRTRAGYVVAGDQQRWTRRVTRVRRVARVLLAAGLLALGYAAYVVVDAKAYQATETEAIRAGDEQTPLW